MPYQFKLEGSMSMIHLFYFKNINAVKNQNVY